MEYVLGIDIGTSGTKTVLVDKDGKIIASATSEYTMYQPHNGWAEQDPQDWWNAVCKTCKIIIQKSKIDPKNINGIGLTGQMHGLVMLDDENNVIRPAILWCDTRTTEECNEITAKVGVNRLLDITANPALEGFTASKIQWVKKYDSVSYNRCKHILLPKDYIRFMLTGDYATDVSDASGMQLLDVPKRSWSDEILDILDIDKSMLGKVYESVEITGVVTKEAAMMTNLVPGIPVVAGAGDNAAAAVGMGVVEDGKAFTSIGTSGVVYAHTKEIAIDPKGRVHTFCAAIPGQWHVMGVTQAAGLSLRWYKDNFCEDYIIKANELDLDPYELIVEDARQIPIGSNRLIYLPYLMGERTPYLDSNARGVFFGISAIHTKKNFIRAILEGVSFSLRDCFEILQGMDIQTNSMIATGGGSRNKLWRQMISDNYNTSIFSSDSKEGPAFGAAILAMVGAGMYTSVENACHSIISIRKTEEPSTDNRIKYNDVYKIYKSLYNINKENFYELSQLGQ